jgi:hypothetical protein
MADNNKPINRSDMRNVTINPKGSRINQDRNPYNPDNGLFKRLTRLFSGPIVNRRQQQYKSERRRRLDKYNFQSAQGQQFKKSSYNPFDYVHSQSMANQNRSERYVDFEQMEYCLHGDTKIAVPGGYKTIKELAEEYGTTEKFVIYAYDHAKKQIVPAFGKQARKTRTDHAWKVIFDNGQEIIGTANHRLMMRDGTYRMIEQLNVGDSLMPFYRKDLSHGQKDEGDGYRWIYTMHQDSERKKGWIAEHTLIAEWVAGRKVTPDEVVHHINFTKYDNRPENVLIMNSKEHLRYHQNIVNEQRKNTKWWNNFKQNHSEWMKKNNPSERKDITFEVILSLCDQHGYNQKNICHMLDTDPNTIKRKLKTKGFDSFEIFAKTYKTGWRNDGCDNTGGKNPRYDHALTFGNICNTYKKGMTCAELALSLNTTAIKISKRIKDNGYANFTDFYNNYSNHKVSKIEYYGFIDLYDLTVDGYKNFATDSVISHNTAEINSALDIYADEMTTSNSLERVLNIDCPNEEIKSVLDTLYYDILNIEFNLFGWSRTMCKFGDFFLYLDIDEKDGVKNAIGLPTYEVERIEGEDTGNPNYIQFQWNSGGMTFENWQIGHFRILGNDKYAPYGTSVLEGARRIWRQLTLLEDAMMAYRIVRSAERRVFYVDVGNVAPNDVEQFMQKAMTTLKRNQVVDEKTGRVDLRYNPLSIEEDYFIPVRGQASTKIESLAGGQYTGDIDDVKYLRDKLFSALKVPQSYLARGEGGDEDKTTLAQKDIRFARTIQRLQRAIVSELEKIGIIHLFILGYRNEDLIKFKLKLNNPSKIAELQELETWKTKFDVASGATEGYFSRRWVAKKIFNMTDEEFLRNQREMFYDSKFKAAVEKAGSEQEAAAGDSDAGLGGLDMGAVASGDDEVPPVDLGALTAEPEGETPMPDNAAPEAPAAGEDTSLLAAPGKRDDRETTTPASRGKFYLPSKFKGGDKRDIGARARSYSSKWGQQQTGKSERSRLGSGTQELFGLGNGIFEEYENSYNEQIIKEEKISPVEGQILKNSSDLKNLLKSLENKDAGKKDVKN